MTTSIINKDSDSDTSPFSKKYIYTPLNEINEPGEYNFYGIIYYSTFPIQEEDNSMIDDEKQNTIYNCIIKLIDQSINCLTNPNNFQDNLITLIIKSTDKENIPFIHNIGDIIRVHRGIYSPKKKRLVYLQILKGNQFKGAWCVFSGASDVLSREMNPYLCSHQHFTFESQDKKNISLMRNWIRNYFNKENSLNYLYETKLINRVNLGSDNDILVQVVHKVELDDQIVFFIQDETDGCELHTSKYFNFIEINDVIRIRAFKIFNKNVLILNSFSNILKIPQFSSYYKIFMNKLTTKLKEIQNLKEDIPMFITNSKEKSPISPLMYNNDSNKKLICKVLLNENENYDTKKFEAITSQDKKFLMNLNIIEIYPKPLYNFVNILCDGCKSSYSITDITLNPSGLFRCEKCKSFKNGILHFNTTLQCRETNMSNQIVTLYLSSFDGEGNGFFGIPPVDAYRNSNEFQKLGIVFKGLCDPGNYVNVLVEQYKGGILRIVGNYENYIKFN